MLNLSLPTSKKTPNVAEMLTKIHARGQGFYECIDNQTVFDDIQAFADEHAQKYDEIVILGIGGSALGPKVLRDALSTSKKHLHIIENIDPSVLDSLLRHVDLKKTLFLVISKSGGTPEALSLYSFFKNEVQKTELNIKNHFVFITDPENGFLRTNEADALATFPIPANVGGRFSVLTAVGLLPAALLGININQLLTGAKNMRDNFLQSDFSSNMCAQMAEFWFENWQNGQDILVTMPYIHDLRTFAEWVGQLVAESTGKVDESGNNVGISPVGALGVTDQHSQLQLYAEGSNNKQYVFISQTDFDVDFEIPFLADHEKLNFMQGKQFSELLTAEKSATIKTLEERERPIAEITLTTMNAEHLGELFMLYEGATAFIGEMMNIDAFNQPGVERSKVLTREFISKLG